MKRALSLLFACLAVLWLSAQADTLTLPANLQTIDDEAFYGDTSLDTVTLGDQVTSIGEKAFANSTLKKIDLPESIKHIADNAFDGVDHPRINANKGTYAYDWAVNNDFIDDDMTPSPLEDFVIENGVVTKYVGNGGDVVVPKYSANGKRIIEIGVEAFYLCDTVTSITLPEGLTSIGNRAFYGCSNLTSITLPEGLTSIGNWAFYECSNLTSITLPEGITSIGGSAFRECESLTSIILPEGLTSIGNGAFYGCSNLTSINIPEGVTTIGSGAFTQCSALTSITFPEKCETSIGQEAFYGCNSLTSITFPEKGSGIGYRAFWYCSNLTSIILPEWVTSIGEGAFGNCIKLTSITIPQGVTSISDWSFYNCWSLTDIILPEGVTAIGDWAFAYCGLTSITIPQSVNSIGWRAFYSHSKDLVIYGVKGSYAEAYANANGIQFKEGIAPQQDVHFSISHKIEGTVLAQGSVSGSFAMSPEASPNATSTLNVTSDYIWTVTASDTSWMKAEKVDNATCRLTLLEADPGKSYASTLTFTVAGQYQYTVNVTLSKPALPVGKPVIKNATTNTIFTAAQTVEYKTSDGNIALVLSAENGCGQYKVVVIALDEAPDFTSAGSNQAERRDTSLFTSNNGYAYNDVIPASLYNEYVNEYKGIPIALNDIPDGKYIKIAVGAYANETDAEPEIWTNIGLKIKKTYAVTGVQLDKSALTLQVGESATLTATITPSNATNKSVTWSSDNTSVATVSNGKITAIGEGSAIITVRTNDGGKTKKCTVNVKKQDTTVHVTGVKLSASNLTMQAGEIKTLEATIYPTDATIKDVTWSSDDPKIATVKDGIITAIGNGTTNIFVETKDGNKKAYCTIVVVSENTIKYDGEMFAKMIEDDWNDADMYIGQAYRALQSPWNQTKLFIKDKVAGVKIVDCITYCIDLIWDSGERKASEIKESLKEMGIEMTDEDLSEVFAELRSNVDIVTFNTLAGFTVEEYAQLVNVIDGSITVLDQKKSLIDTFSEKFTIFEYSAEQIQRDPFSVNLYGCFEDISNYCLREYGRSIREFAADVLNDMFKSHYRDIYKLGLEQKFTKLQELAKNSTNGIEIAGYIIKYFTKIVECIIYYDSIKNFSDAQITMITNLKNGSPDSKMKAICDHILLEINMIATDNSWVTIYEEVKNNAVESLIDEVTTFSLTPTMKFSKFILWVAQQIRGDELEKTIDYLTKYEITRDSMRGVVKGLKSIECSPDGYISIEQLNKQIESVNGYFVLMRQLDNAHVAYRKETNSSFSNYNDTLYPRIMEAFNLVKVR